jgi:hypothetical protein
MRFRRKAKLFPGVYLNFSKTGISTTIGVPGASINIGKKGTYLNTGIPGTGLYDRKRIGGQNNQYIPDSPSYINTDQIDIEEGAIKSKEAEQITSDGLQDLKSTLLECFEERNELSNEIRKANTRLFFSNLLMIVTYVLVVGFFIKWIKENRKNEQEILNDLKTQKANCYVNIDYTIDDSFERVFLELLEKYKSLITINRIWQITSSISIDRFSTRSAASSSVMRIPIRFDFANFDVVKSKYDAMHFKNTNGRHVYIYPAFIILVDKNKQFGLIDIQDLDFTFFDQSFVEDGVVPTDAIVTGNTWLKVNKDGSPDRRFKDNHTIPLCKYGAMNLKSDKGLNEAYHFSSYQKSSLFSDKMVEYQRLISTK